MFDELLLVARCPYSSSSSSESPVRNMPIWRFQSLLYSIPTFNTLFQFFTLFHSFSYYSCISAICNSVNVAPTALKVNITLLGNWFIQSDVLAILLIWNIWSILRILQILQIKNSDFLLIQWVA